MKFPFYTNLNDNSSSSNYLDISKQRARALSAPPSYTKFPKSAVGIGLILSYKQNTVTGNECWDLKF